MNRLLLLIVSGILLVSCNPGKKPAPENNDARPKSEVDSLMDQVMTGHDEAMAKYGKMQGLRNRIQVIIDSIDKLPAKAKTAAAPYAERLRNTAARVNNALSSMDKWMEEFNMDSALNNLQVRLQYLSEERNKVGRIRDTFISAFHNADSLLRQQ
jgi:hypothetical protein